MLKLDRLGVDAIWQHPTLVVIGAQTKLLLLISNHPAVVHAEASVFRSISGAFKRRLETLPGDVILSLRHTFRAELVFCFSVIDVVTLRA